MGRREDLVEAILQIGVENPQLGKPDKAKLTRMSEDQLDGAYSFLRHQFPEKPPIERAALSVLAFLDKEFDDEAFYSGPSVTDWKRVASEARQMLKLGTAAPTA